VFGVLKSCFVAPVGGPSGWTACAAEGGNCAFIGTRRVAFGANGAFGYTLRSGSVACTAAVFGDPLPGAAKQCYLPPAGGPAAGWTSCAAENGVCAAAVGQPVAYGANGAFAHTPATGTVTCGNTLFGDPLSGTVKSCYLRSGPPSGYPNVCAAENGACTFSGFQTVAYGANGRYVYRSFTGSTPCTSTAMGNDPMFGVAKSCYLVG
jgi:hypothetical protein